MFTCSIPPRHRQVQSSCAEATGTAGAVRKSHREELLNSRLGAYHRLYLYLRSQVAALPMSIQAAHPSWPTAFNCPVNKTTLSFASIFACAKSSSAFFIKDAPHFYPLCVRWLQ